MKPIAAKPAPTVSIDSIPLRLPLWHRLVMAAIRTVYFRHVTLASTLPAPEAGKPRLWLISHRNGALDACIVLAFCPNAQFLVSMQLLRNPFLRALFSGIPVVREKDRQRYGMNRSDIADPIALSCQHMQRGGELAIFPEGSSEWGHKPQAYHSGSARIVRRLLESGITPQVIPLGLFYRAPDKFRADAEILAGAAVDLPPRLPDETARQWENRLQAAMVSALDAVSVNCADKATFEQVERLAGADNTSSYAQAFVYWQNHAAHSPLPAAPPLRHAHSLWWAIPFMAVFCILFAPVLLASWFAGKQADGKNTVSFFRVLGGLAALLLYLPFLLAAFYCAPLPIGIAAILAYLGWKLWQ
ncbi:hypothetical protein [Stenoxybacter acetivorans]|uniref:hypothetical protein n=1 Tax=Stenoxybacter acetivorans TaxID=422441 RepID=UPI0006894B68|nr:hypothetical protein [Stenoxybacter acetivorans]